MTLKMDDITLLKKMFETEQPIFDGKHLVLTKIETINNIDNSIDNGKILFHGTLPKNIPNIIKNGFIPNLDNPIKISRQGIYLSDIISQSLYY
jgi:hypothetical protein